MEVTSRTPAMVEVMIAALRMALLLSLGTSKPRMLVAPGAAEEL
jgi:hypothetical protein